MRVSTSFFSFDSFWNTHVDVVLGTPGSPSPAFVQARKTFLSSAFTSEELYQLVNQKGLKKLRLPVSLRMHYLN